MNELGEGRFQSRGGGSRGGRAGGGASRFGGPGRDFNTGPSGGGLRMPGGGGSGGGFSPGGMIRRNSDPTYFGGPPGGGSPSQRFGDSGGQRGGGYSLLSRGGSRPGGFSGGRGGAGFEFGALKFASGGSSLSGGGFNRNSYRRPIRGVPPPVGGSRSYSSFKPRGRGGSFPFRGGNRPRYDVGQLKERSHIPEKEWNVCWEFNTKRGCRRGSRCKWKHISFETGGVVHPVTQEQLNTGLCPTIQPGGAVRPATGPSPAAIELAEKLAAAARSPPPTPAKEKKQEGESDNKEASAAGGVEPKPAEGEDSAKPDAKEEATPKEASAAVE